ncbi:MAG: hypothetical protein RLZZ164_1090 [Actinomycetota bacterium]|jgi:riboflavin biosynthesis pyrimidine reductase
MPFPQLLPLKGIRYICVTNLASEFVGPDGTSHSLSNSVDRQLLIEARKVSSLIVTDVATAVAENYRASKYAPIEIWSKSGNDRGFIPEQPTGTEPISFVAIRNLEVEIDRANEERTLLECGPTLAAAMADGIAQAVITVANRSQGPQWLFERAAARCLTRLGLDDLTEYEWHTDDSNVYLVASRRG